MRRADRLFQIIELLRGRRLTTARHLAERLEVSERTIYRDIRDLMLSGVPVEGEAGVGYALRKGFDLPPLMFDRDELEALVLGARFVQSWGGSALSEAARRALVKIEAVLPADRRLELRRSRLFAVNFNVPAQLTATMDTVREAINRRHVLCMDYRREDGESSTREVRPLAMYFWGPVWTLAAWCELRQDFRNFRIDRIAEARPVGRNFADEPGKTLDDFLSTINRD